MAARFHGIIHKGAKLSPKAILRVLELTDAFRRKTRFLALLEMAQADFRGRRGYETEQYPQQDFWENALSAALTVDTGAIAKGQKNGQTIRKAIHRARLQRLQTLQ
jgi:tRNA nucleotidyltransferase (CCA-adding enzyme)